VIKTYKYEKEVSNYHDLLVVTLVARDWTGFGALNAD
jgi:hypothetical protein